MIYVANIKGKTQMRDPAELPGVFFCHFCISTLTPGVALMITLKGLFHGFKKLGFVSH